MRWISAIASSTRLSSTEMSVSWGKIRRRRPGGPPRESLYVVSKVWNTNHAYDHVIAACEATLRELGLEVTRTLRPDPTGLTPGNIAGRSTATSPSSTMKRRRFLFPGVLTVALPSRMCPCTRPGAPWKSSPRRGLDARHRRQQLRRGGALGVGGIVQGSPGGSSRSNVIRTGSTPNSWLGVRPVTSRSWPTPRCPPPGMFARSASGNPRSTVREVPRPDRLAMECSTGRHPDPIQYPEAFTHHRELRHL